MDRDKNASRAVCKKPVNSQNLNETTSINEKNKVFGVTTSLKFRSALSCYFARTHLVYSWCKKLTMDL